MNVLYLSHKNPVREDEGAKLVVMGTLRHVAAQGCRVTLICLDGDREGGDLLRSFCHEVRLVPHTPRGRAAGLVRSFTSGLPYSVLCFQNTGFAEAVADAVSRQVFDVVHMETALMYQYASCLKRLPVLIRHHNLEGDLLRQQALSTSNPLKRAVLSWQANSLTSYEKAAISGASMSVAITDADKATICENYGLKVPVYVVPSGIDAPESMPEGPTDHCLVFSGRIEWPPNAEAARWFAKRVFPELRRLFPGLKFYIVGGRPTKQTRELAGNGVVVTGFVDSVREYLDRAEVYVVPLLSGSGMRIKILEAMSRGKAIVSTPKGAEGIACEDGRDILLAGSAEEFVASVAALLREPSRRREIGVEAFKTVKENYAWDAVASRFVECYKIAASRAGEDMAEVGRQ